ncbi:hypothetical protein NS506_04183 [Nocardia seriolae]|uniref:Uncharacterized protein n=1 Tax=Nocardia seriolae TaxID=37332 RepID=A0ABC8AW32_9NOCA|nr:hypothetical protein NS506_04183 [Nocardia seriolae]
MGRSVGRSRSSSGRRQRISTTRMPAKETALSANTTLGPVAATSAPARAGPTARPMFMPMLLKAAAAGIWLRGTRSG